MACAASRVRSDKELKELIRTDPADSRTNRIPLQGGRRTVSLYPRPREYVMRAAPRVPLLPVPPPEGAEWI